METSSSIAHVAMALLIDFTCVYYVDLESGNYECYSTNPQYQDLKLHTSGDDFFEDTRRDTATVVYKDDRELMYSFMTRENLMQKYRDHDTSTIVYRLILNGEPVYHTTRILHDAGGENGCRLILAVMNVDKAVRTEMATRTYNAIAQTLAQRCAKIYFVDLKTERYIEYDNSGDNTSLEATPQGNDFFAVSRRMVMKVIHPDDQARLLEVFDRETILSRTDGGHKFQIEYRLVMDGGWHHVRLSAMRTENDESLIFAVDNIDEEIQRREQMQQELHEAHEKAYRDGLTGVKNKTAYREAAQKMQAGLDAGSRSPFAILVCDVNGLKEVNDRKGHIEGDAYIRSACHLICHIWTHSPVFRIGGDEFAVILQDEDYENRNTLLRAMEQQVMDNQANGKVVMAAGLSEYNPETDTSVDEVFRRADSMMYMNKSALKGKQE